MSYYKEQMCLLLTQRAGDWLSQIAWPRTTMTCSLLLALASSMGGFFAVHALGIENLALRFLAGAASGYFTYLLFYSLWLLQFSAKEAKALVLHGADTIRTKPPGESAFDESLNEIADRHVGQALREGEGMLGILVLTGILGFFFIACHAIYHAPWYLGQLLVQSGKIRHAAAPRGGNWDFMYLPLWQSWPVGLLVVVHSAVVGSALGLFLAQRAIKV